MAEDLRQQIEARILALEEQRARWVKAYQDREQEVNELTQQLSDRVRQARTERSSAALEAAKCQQAIDELKGLLAREGGQ